MGLREQDPFGVRGQHRGTREASIPGLTGFGEKGASMLIGAYEHLENIPLRAEQWKVKPRGALTDAS